MFTRLVDRLLAELEAHDAATARHARAVAALCAQVVARDPDLLRLENGATVDAEQTRLAALVHDTGKLYIPAWLLQAPRPLWEWERRAYIESHPQAGLTRLYHEAHAPLPELAVFMTAGHHERWDGSGYPHHARGLAIHPAARLCALADVYDALTTARPYHTHGALSPAAALDYLQGQIGTLFCPQMTPAFCAAARALAGRVA